MKPTPLEEIVGKTFGLIEVISETEGLPSSRGGILRRFECRCSCGETLTVRLSDIRSGNTRSCGCARKATLRQISTTHGKTNTSTYSIWNAMMNRHRGNSSPERYFDRGIRVCRRWHKFENFLEDMGEKPVGKSIDRVNNNRGYSLQNCRWATTKQQARNKGNTLFVEYKGERHCFRSLMEELNLNPKMVWGRMKYGWPVEEAIEIPKGGKRQA